MFPSCYSDGVAGSPTESWSESGSAHSSVLAIGSSILNVFSIHCTGVLMALFNAFYKLANMSLLDLCFLQDKRSISVQPEKMPFLRIDGTPETARSQGFHWRARQKSGLYPKK